MTPKTEHSRRTMDIPAAIVKRRLGYREACPPIASKKGDFIFRNESGTPIDPDNWFTTGLCPRLCGRSFAQQPLTEDSSEQQVGPHASAHLRSLLINQGASIKYVSKQLGHANSPITLDLYGHLFKETGESEMKKLSMRIAGAVKSGNVVEMATGTEG